MIEILKINGKELHRLEIIKYTPKYELLDGEGTERSKAPGWGMIRKPQGIICNFKLEIFETRTDNPDFIYFMEQFVSLGSIDFIPIMHRDPMGRVWEQMMYFVVDEFDIENFEDGYEYTSDIKAAFIAKKGKV